MYIQPSTAKALRLYFWIISSGTRDKKNHVFKPWQGSAEIIVFYVHHHHGGVLGGKGSVNQDFECCDVGRGGGDVAGLVEYITAYGQPDSFLFLLVWFVIANYFAVSDISVFRDVGECD
jgi:hypothetical protein